MPYSRNSRNLSIDDMLYIKLKRVQHITSTILFLGIVIGLIAIVTSYSSASEGQQGAMAFLGFLCTVILIFLARAMLKYHDLTFEDGKMIQIYWLGNRRVETPLEDIIEVYIYKNTNVYHRGLTLQSTKITTNRGVFRYDSQHHSRYRVLEIFLAATLRGRVFAKDAGKRIDPDSLWKADA